MPARFPAPLKNEGRGVTVTAKSHKYGPTEGTGANRKLALQSHTFPNKKRHLYTRPHDLLSKNKQAFFRCTSFETKCLSAVSQTPAPCAASCVDGENEPLFLSNSRQMKMASFVRKIVEIQHSSFVRYCKIKTAPHKVNFTTQAVL